MPIRLPSQFLWALAACTVWFTACGTSSANFASPHGMLPVCTLAPADQIQVGVLLLDGVYNSDAIAPIDVFHHTSSHANPGMRVVTIGRTLDPIRTYEGLLIKPDYAMANTPPVDVLVIPSTEHSMTSEPNDRELVQWLRVQGAQAEYVLALCDGAFPMAAAGLLDGLQCTTFPGDREALRSAYPKLTVLDNVLFVADGKAITAAGGAQSYAPAMYLVELIYGKRTADGIGRGLVLDWDLPTVPHKIVP